MRLLLSILCSVFITVFSQAQIFHNDQSSGCDIEVSYAISETEGTGEYVMTDLILLNPGMSWDFRDEVLSVRNLFATEDHDVMFVMRYPNSGMTFYVNANSPDGYERLVMGCSGTNKVVYTRNGEFHFDDAN